MSIKMTLSALSVRTLVEVAKQLHGGALGFDPFRDPRTSKKPALIDFIAEGRTDGEVESAIQAVQGRDVAVDNRYEVNADGKDAAAGGDGVKEGAAGRADGGDGGEAQGQGEGEADGQGEGEGEPTQAEKDLAEAEAEMDKVAQDKNLKPVDKARAMQALAEAIEEAQKKVEAERKQREKEARKKAEEQARKKVEEQAEGRKIEVYVNDEKKGEIEEHTHPLFDKVLRLCAAGVNVLLVGPAGCGKTHLAGQVAKALGKSFGSISGSAGVSESQLTGRLLPTGEGGRFEYTPSVFVKEYENGGAFLFDEIDAFDPNVLLVANQALANGGFFVEARAAAGLSTFVQRHPDSILIGSANTFGTGADMLYVGRNGLDAASLDRWYVVRMTYDPAYEAQLIGLPKPRVAQWKPAAAPTEDEIRVLGQWVLSVREKAAAAKLRRVVSTRAVQKAIAARKAGIPAEEIKADLLSGWSKDEMVKVGHAA